MSMSTPESVTEASVDTASDATVDTAPDATAPAEVVDTAADDSVPAAAPAPVPTPSPAPSPTPSPRPAPPKPGPRPGPPAAAAPAPAAPTATAAPVPAPAEVAAPPVDQSVTSNEFGYVAEDGTVFVRVEDVERPVGSYPGATPAEALAYFARKFDALAAEIALLEQRVSGAEVPVKDLTSSVDRLRVAVGTANAVGDLASLNSRLDVLAAHAEEKRAEADAARTKAREAARADKERVVTESEALATSTAWKATGDRFRELLEEWKRAPRLDRKTDDELWKRFSAARSAFDKVRRQHFASLDAERAEAKARKEALVKEAESLQASTEWGPTAGAYRDLMTQWKAAGRAGRDDEDALWARFRAAQDAFFGARNAVFDERDSDQKVNLEQKEALVVEAEALMPITDHRAARRALRSIGERWEGIGHVPRGDRDRIEGRLRRVEDAVRDAEQDEWRRTNPEARARAEGAVSMLQQAISQLEAKAEKARAAGKAKDLANAEEALEARRSWLAEAEKALQEFTR